MRNDAVERIPSTRAQDGAATASSCLKLSVVLPVFEECDAIGPFLSELRETLERTQFNYEIIAVDDGSRDSTPEKLKRLAEKAEGCLRIITHPYNKGNGASIRTGIRAARGEFILCMDADGQHDPCGLEDMFQVMEQYDLVVGARSEDYECRRHRRIANQVYNSLASWLAEFPIKDLTSGFRLFRASAVKKYVALFPSRFSYPTTSTLIFLKTGYNVKYVYVPFRPRQGGSSKIRILNDGWRFLLIIFKVIIIYEPLRLFLPVSLVSFLLAALLTLVNTNFFTKGIFVSNSSVVLLVLGVLVLLLGFISEQIASLQISLKHDQ